jgi:large exoprotein involved in heme utilization and adhesion
VTADALSLADATISTRSLTADGGDIVLSIGRLLELRNGAITTSVAGGAGSGGNIAVSASAVSGPPVLPTTFIVLGDSRVVANARRGAGGNITLVAQQFLASPTTVISASSELGIDGQVSIDAPEVDLTGGLTGLSASFVDPAGLLRDACSARYRGGRSSLVATARGATPETPAGRLRAYYERSDPTAAGEHAGAPEAFAFTARCGPPG